MTPRVQRSHRGIERRRNGIASRRINYRQRISTRASRLDAIIRPRCLPPPAIPGLIIGHPRDRSAIIVPRRRARASLIPSPSRQAGPLDASGPRRERVVQLT